MDSYKEWQEERKKLLDKLKKCPSNMNKAIYNISMKKYEKEFKEYFFADHEVAEEMFRVNPSLLTQKKEEILNDKNIKKEDKELAWLVEKYFSNDKKCFLV